MACEGGGGSADILVREGNRGAGRLRAHVAGLHSHGLFMPMLALALWGLRGMRGGGMGSSGLTQLACTGAGLSPLAVWQLACRDLPICGMQRANEMGLAVCTLAAGRSATVVRQAVHAAAMQLCGWRGINFRAGREHAHQAR